MVSAYGNYILSCWNCGKVKVININDDLPDGWGFYKEVEEGLFEIVSLSPDWNVEALSDLFCSDECFDEHYGVESEEVDG